MCIRRLSRERLVPLLIALVAVGCDGNATGLPDDELSISAAGREERGSELTLSVRSEGAPVPVQEVAWSVAPDGAAEFTTPGTARLLSAGAVTFTARVRNRTASMTVNSAVPPTVVFDRVVAGNRDLWRVALDGQDLTRLTTHPGEDADPSASDGTVVFVSYRDGNAELYSVPLQGGEERRLTSTSYHETSPALRGGRVAYISEVSGLPRLWTRALSASVAEAVAPGFGSHSDIHASPSLRPGASAVAFMTTTRAGADIFGVTLTGGTPEPLVTGDRADMEPAWSPDGSRLAFVSNRDGDAQVYLLTLATGAVVRLTRGPGTSAQPAWLPDGRLVYTAAQAGVTTIRWLDPASPERTFPVPTGGPNAANPSGVL